MSILWRHVTKLYLKAFAFPMCALTILGFFLQYKKLALFILSGASFSQTLIFFLCLLLTSLPLSIAIGAGIASFLTAQNLRAALMLKAHGISSLFSPVLQFSAFWVLLNYFLLSEGIPYIKLFINKLQIESQNPISLVQHKFINPNTAIHFLEDEKALVVLTLDSLTCTDDLLVGHNVSWITYLPDLIIDRQEQAISPASFFPYSASDHAVYSLNTLLSSPMNDLIQGELIKRGIRTLLPFVYTLIGLALGRMFL